MMSMGPRPQNGKTQVAELQSVVETLIEREVYTSQISAKGKTISIEDVSKDIVDEGREFSRLAQFGAQVQVVGFAGRDNSTLPVPFSPAKYESVDFREGGPRWTVPAREALGMFVSRVAEFLDVRINSWASSGPNGNIYSPPPSVPTTVETNREDDTVVYCKGFFVSTQLAFGVSNPARNNITPGQYSFGIIKNGRPIFEPLLWSVPYHGNIRVRLP